MSDPFAMINKSDMQKYADVSNSILDAVSANGGPVKQLSQYVRSTLPKEDMVQKEDIQTFWAPIFDHAVEAKDEADRDKGVGRYYTI